MLYSFSIYGKTFEKSKNLLERQYKVCLHGLWVSVVSIDLKLLVESGGPHTDLLPPLTFIRKS